VLRNSDFVLFIRSLTLHQSRPLSLTSLSVNFHTEFGELSRYWSITTTHFLTKAELNEHPRRTPFEVVLPFVSGRVG